jgi:hypothetical protein
MAKPAVRPPAPARATSWKTKTNFDGLPKSTSGTPVCFTSARPVDDAFISNRRQFGVYFRVFDTW